MELEARDQPSYSNPDAEAGTNCHEAVFSNAAYGRLTPEQQDAVDIARGFVPGDGWIVEQHMELVDETGEIITAGTPDAFRIVGNTAELIDFKFGWEPPKGTEAHYQLGSYAAMIAQVSGTTSVTARIIAPNARPIEGEAYTFTDFEAIAKTVKTIIAKCEKYPFHYNQGSWCKYCKGKAQCVIFTSATDAIQKADNPVITKDNAAYWWDLSELVEGRAKAIKELIQAKFDDREGQLPGFDLKPGRISRTMPPPIEVWRQAAKIGIKPDEFMDIVSISIGKTERLFVEKYMSQGVKTKKAAKEIFNHEIEFGTKQAAPSMVRVEEKK